MKAKLVVLFALPILTAAAPVTDCWSLIDKFCCYVGADFSPGQQTQCSQGGQNWPCPLPNSATRNDPVATCTPCEAGEAGCRVACLDQNPQPITPPGCIGVKYTCTTPGNCTANNINLTCKVKELSGESCVVTDGDD